MWIPKPDGKQRPLGVPAIKDRVAQTAAVLVLEPIFEVDLQPEQYAYRSDRSALDAEKNFHRRPSCEICMRLGSKGSRICGRRIAENLWRNANSRPLRTHHSEVRIICALYGNLGNAILRMCDVARAQRRNAERCGMLSIWTTEM